MIKRSKGVMITRSKGVKEGSTSSRCAAFQLMCQPVRAIDFYFFLSDSGGRAGFDAVSS